MDNSSEKKALNRLIYQACLAAVWADRQMSQDEQHFLSHLTETLTTSDAERESLRRLQLEGACTEKVFSEVRALDKTSKTIVFDTCLEILASDREIRKSELAFLNDLRKACPISRRHYRRKVSRVRKETKARLLTRQRVMWLAIIVTIGLLCAAIPRIMYEDIALKDSTTGQLIFTSLLADMNAPPSWTSGEEIYARTRDSIVSVQVSINHQPMSSGSGFVLGRDLNGVTYVVTNRHVIHNEDTEQGRSGDSVQVEVGLLSGANYEAVLDYYSRKHDIAILAVQGVLPEIPALPLVLKDELQTGQQVYTLGSPLGLKHSFTAGVISALRQTYIQTDATIHSGSSGGPLLDQHGALCGVITRGHLTKDYSFALYADTILDVLHARQSKRP